MADFYSLPGEQLLAMEPEELAGVVLMFMNKAIDQRFHPGNFAGHARSFPDTNQDALQRALMEAWSWLTREGLLAMAPGDSNWYFVTRRGNTLQVERWFDTPIFGEPIVLLPNSNALFLLTAAVPRSRLYPPHSAVLERFWLSPV